MRNETHQALEAHERVMTLLISMLDKRDALVLTEAMRDELDTLRARSDAFSCGVAARMDALWRLAEARANEA